VQPDVIDRNTPPEVLAEINKRLLQAMQTCMQALNLGGLKLQRLIDAVTTRCALRVSALTSSHVIQLQKATFPENVLDSRLIKTEASNFVI
jgi:hypothetical protein